MTAGKKGHIDAMRVVSSCAWFADVNQAHNDGGAAPLFIASQIRSCGSHAVVD